MGRRAYQSPPSRVRDGSGGCEWYDDASQRQEIVSSTRRRTMAGRSVDAVLYGRVGGLETRQRGAVFRARDGGAPSVPLLTLCAAHFAQHVVAPALKAGLEIVAHGHSWNPEIASVLDSLYDARSRTRHDPPLSRESLRETCGRFKHTNSSRYGRNDQLDCERTRSQVLGLQRALRLRAALGRADLVFVSRWDVLWERPMPLADAPAMLAPRGAAPRFWLPRHCAARHPPSCAGGGAGGAARARVRPGRRGAGAHLRRGRRLRVAALLPRAPRTSELDRQPDALRKSGAPILRARPVARDRQRRRRRLRDGGRRAAVRAWARGDRRLCAAPRVDCGHFSSAGICCRCSTRRCASGSTTASILPSDGSTRAPATSARASRRTLENRRRRPRSSPRHTRAWRSCSPAGSSGAAAAAATFAAPRRRGAAARRRPPLLPAPRWPCASASSAAPPAGATRPRRGARPAPLRPTTRRVCSSGSGGRWHPESCAAPRSAVFD